MKYMRSLCLASFIFFSCNHAQDDAMRFSALKEPVEIITDQWGVPHIYAKNEHDLFFAQGFQAAKDRLFQLEMFRRRANGTMAEVLGSRELKRDIGARLFRYREIWKKSSLIIIQTVKPLLPHLQTASMLM